MRNKEGKVKKTHQPGDTSMSDISTRILRGRALRIHTWGIKGQWTDDTGERVRPRYCLAPREPRHFGNRNSIPALAPTRVSLVAP